MGQVLHGCARTTEAARRFSNPCAWYFQNWASRRIFSIPHSSKCSLNEPAFLCGRDDPSFRVNGGIVVWVDFYNRAMRMMCVLGEVWVG